MWNVTPVRDVMSMDLIVVPPTSTLREIGEIMTRSRVHSVVVAHPVGQGSDLRGGWQVVSDLDLLEHRGALDEPAASIARTPPLVVTGSESVARCAELLVQHRAGHLLVSGFDGDPVGIASSLDLVRGLAQAPDGARETCGDGGP